jgi:hypothetical protein
MTKDDITRMAKEAGFCGFDGDNKCLREFANVVAAAEREACAVIAFNAKTYLEAAESIRARGRDEDA